MADKPEDTALNLIWSTQPGSLQGSIEITNDPLPTHLIMTQDLWQALHDPTEWAWISEDPAITAVGPEGLDHGHTLTAAREGTTQYWAHFDASNLWASYKVVQVQADDSIVLKLEGWSVKNEDTERA
jgi:hypothetical protein